MADWSKLPPDKACYVLFSGSRHVRDALYEHIDLEFMEVIEDYDALVVVTMGRRKRFRLDSFEGKWKTIDIGALAQ